MGKKGPYDRAVENIPESFKRIYRFIMKPAIPKENIADTEMSYVYVDFVAILAVISSIVAALKYLVPDYLEINPISLINWHVFVVLITINTFLFSSIIYVLLIVPLKYKNDKDHFKIFCQSIKAFAIENVLIAIMITVAMNRIIIKGSLKISVGNLDLWIGGFTAIGSLFILIWLLVRPVISYLNQYYSKIISYIFTCGAVFISISSIPFIQIKYFNRIIDPKEFCSQYMSYKYKNELTDCTPSKDCLNQKCLSEIDRFIRP